MGCTPSRGSNRIAVDPRYQGEPIPRHYDKRGSVDSLKQALSPQKQRRSYGASRRSSRRSSANRDANHDANRDANLRRFSVSTGPDVLHDLRVITTPRRMARTVKAYTMPPLQIAAQSPLRVLPPIQTRMAQAVDVEVDAREFVRRSVVKSHRRANVMKRPVVYTRVQTVSAPLVSSVQFGAEIRGKAASARDCEEDSCVKISSIQYDTGVARLTTPPLILSLPGPSELPGQLPLPGISQHSQRSQFSDQSQQSELLEPSELSETSELIGQSQLSEQLELVDPSQFSEPSELHETSQLPGQSHLSEPSQPSQRLELPELPQPYEPSQSYESSEFCDQSQLSEQLELPEASELIEQSQLFERLQEPEPRSPGYSSMERTHDEQPDGDEVDEQEGEGGGDASSPRSETRQHPTEHTAGGDARPSSPPQMCLRIQQMSPVEVQQVQPFSSRLEPLRVDAVRPMNASHLSNHPHTFEIREGPSKLRLSHSSSPKRNEDVQMSAEPDDEIGLLERVYNANQRSMCVRVLANPVVVLETVEELPEESESEVSPYITRTDAPVPHIELSPKFRLTEGFQLYGDSRSSERCVRERQLLVNLNSAKDGMSEHPEDQADQDTIDLPVDHGDSLSITPPPSPSGSLRSSERCLRQLTNPPIRADWSHAAPLNNVATTLAKCTSETFELSEATVTNPSISTLEAPDEVPVDENDIIAECRRYIEDIISAVIEQEKANKEYRHIANDVVSFVIRHSQEELEAEQEATDMAREVVSSVIRASQERLQDISTEKSNMESNKSMHEMALDVATSKIVSAVLHKSQQELQQEIYTEESDLESKKSTYEVSLDVTTSKIVSAALHESQQELQQEISNEESNLESNIADQEVTDIAREVVSSVIGDSQDRLQETATEESNIESNGSTHEMALDVTTSKLVTAAVHESQQELQQELQSEGLPPSPLTKDAVDSDTGSIVIEARGYVEGIINKAWMIVRSMESPMEPAEDENAGLTVVSS